MTPPDCTDHGTLILEYVLGNLDDSESLQAETASTECASCRTWLEKQFSGPAFTKVEAAVSQSIQNTSLPNQQRHYGWLKVAAAIVVFAGGVAVMQRPDHSTSLIVHQESQNPSTLIGAFDFEGGIDNNASVAADGSSIAAESLETAEADPLFSDDLENGGTGSWTIHT